MRDDGRVAGALGHLDGIEGLGEGADLVDLDQDRVGDAFIDAFLENFGVGDEQVIAYQLDAIPQFFGQQLPAFPVVFGHAVFDGDNRVTINEVGVEINHVCGGLLLLGFILEDVFAILVELTGGDIECQQDIFPRLVAGCPDGVHYDFQSFFVALEVRCKAALVTDCSVIALILEDFLEGVENFSAHAQGLFKGVGPGRHDHEFLDIDIVVGVLAAINDVHHRQRQFLGIGAAEILVEGQA